jgi:hypothetical protein
MIEVHRVTDMVAHGELTATHQILLDNLPTIELSLYIYNFAKIVSAELCGDSCYCKMVGDLASKAKTDLEAARNGESSPIPLLLTATSLSVGITLCDGQNKIDNSVWKRIVDYGIELLRKSNTNSKS